MNAVSDLLLALQHDPADVTGWLALADALEDGGEGERAELARLVTLLRTHRMEDRRQEGERRVRELLAAGVQPCVPELVNGVGMRFVLVPPGRFLMGSPRVEEWQNDNERPAREVVLTRAFYLGVHPVTQEQYERVTGRNPSWFAAARPEATSVKGMATGRFPVEMVSWDGASEFCRWLSETGEERRRGRAYRLPSEAEWEYACRAGGSSTTRFHFGDSCSPAQANCKGDYSGQVVEGADLGRTCEVGSYPPNAFGLHDLHGNVWEWCADWYGDEFYANRPHPDEDPAGPPAALYRVIRGGSWCYYGQFCRSASRRWHAPATSHADVGFRVALVPAEK